MAKARRRFVLDTDTISYILRKNALVIERLRYWAEEGAEFYLCPVVYYEIVRGLLYRDAKRQLDIFKRLASTFRWKDLDREVWEAAAELWADLRRQGTGLAGEADLLIAIYSRHLGATVVTHNTGDFTRLDVAVADWSL